MLMGANDRRNDGSRNDGATAPNTQQLHHRLGHINRTLHADIEKLTTLEKTFNYLHKINSYFYEKIIILLKKFAFDCWHNTVLWYTTNKTQHKIHSWFIISFETFVDLVKAVFGEMGCLSWIGLGTSGSCTVCWQRQKMVIDSDRNGCWQRQKMVVDSDRRWLLTATEDGCWQRQKMVVDSDRRWLLTATDDQFVDRCTIYWQLTV